MIRLSASPLGAASNTLRIAWIVEIACVGIGLLLAIIVGLQAGGIGAGTIAAAPFAAAAFVELARIPLVRSYFTVQGLCWKLIAVGAIILAGTLTFENLLFGFERAFSVRIEAVRMASEAVDQAKENAANLTKEAAELQTAKAREDGKLPSLDNREQRVREDTLRDRQDQTDRSRRGEDRSKSDELQAERKALVAQQRNEQAAMARICQNTPDRCDRSLSKRQQKSLDEINRRIELQEQEKKHHSETEDANINAAVARRDAELVAIKLERQAIADEQNRLSGRLSDVRSHLSGAIVVEQAAVSAAEAQRRQSQMHRLARFFFARDDTPAAMRTVTWFSAIAAAVLCTVGSVLAALHFCTLHQLTIPKRPGRVTQALRGWIARKRRKHSVVKKVEVVREVEVPVERIVEHKVEVPVLGIPSFPLTEG